MSHPLDQQLADSGPLRWIVPSFVLAAQRASVVLIPAAVWLLFMWVYPQIAPARFGASEWVRFLESLLLSVVAIAIFTGGYWWLARTEGAPHGVGDTVELNELPLRLLLLTIFWSVFFVLMLKLLEGVLDLVMPSLLRATGVASFIRTSLMVILLTSAIVPWMILLSLTQVMSCILMVRTSAPPVVLVKDAFSIMWENPWRVVLPLAIVIFAIGTLLLIVFSTWKLGAVIGLLSVMGKTPVWLYWILSLVMAMVSLASWFVLERAYVPELGQQPGDDDGALEAASEVSADRTATPEESEEAKLRKQLADLNAVPASKALALFKALNQSHVPWAAFDQCMATVASDQHLAIFSDLLQRYESMGRHRECAELVPRILKLEPSYFNQDAARLFKLSRGLVEASRFDLALKLFGPFLREQRQHPEHLNAVLTTARLLMTHANKPEMARQLLEQMKALYPQDKSLLDLLKLLTPKQ
jgi:hypothetical protein